MNKNMGKILAFLAVVGGLGAYYVMVLKPKSEMASTDTKEQKPVEAKQEEAPKQEAVVQKQEEKASDIKPEEKKTEQQKPQDTAPAADGYTDETIAAIIDGVDKKVSIADVKRAMDILPAQMRQIPFTTLYPILVRQAVDFILLEHEATKEGFDKKAEVVKAIEERKKSILIGSYLEKEVEAKVSEETLKQKYEDIKKMIPADEKEFEVALIMVKDESTAKALIQKMTTKKATFDECLSESIDPKTKETGGKVGFLKRMELGQELYTKMVEAKDGDVIAMPLNLGKEGSGIVRVLSRRPLQAPEFEKVKGEIRKALMPELSMDIVKGLKAASGIKLYNLEGKEIPERTEEELKKLETEAPSTVDASKLSPDFVCATYNDGKITLKDVKDAYDALPDMLKMLPFEKIYELILIRTINDRIILKNAEKSVIASDKKVQDQMKSEVKLVVQEAYLKAKAEAAITETDLKSEYNSIVKNMADKNEMEYRLRHIAFKTEDEAKAALKKLKAGESFDKLVESSTDESTKDKKGELGYVKRQMLPADIFDLVSKATKGTFINQPCKFGDDVYSVIRVEDKRPVTPPTFEQMKEKIKNGLMAKRAITVLDDLRAKFNVQYQNIKGLPSSDEIQKIVKEINQKMTQVMDNKKA